MLQPFTVDGVVILQIHPVVLLIIWMVLDDLYPLDHLVELDVSGLVDCRQG